MRYQYKRASTANQGLTHVFKTIQVLISFAAGFAAKGLLLLHAQGAWIRSTRLRVNDGKGTIAVLVQLLGLMAVRFVISRLEQI
jgi:hypothetical protein